MSNTDKFNWQRARETAAVVLGVVAMVTAALYRFVPPVSPALAVAYLALAVAWLAVWLALRVEARIRKLEKHRAGRP